MKQIGTQTQRAAAMEANKRAASTEIDSSRPKKPRHLSKKLHDQRRGKTRVNIGDAFERWRQLKAQKDFKTDAELANFLLNSYENGPPTTTSHKRLSVFPAPVGGGSSLGVGLPDRIYWADDVTLSADEGPVAEEVDSCEVSSDEDYMPPISLSYLRAKSSENRQPLERSSSTETCESVYYQYPLMMSSPNRVERETSVQPSENETEPEKEDAAVQRQKNPDKRTATKQSENKENRDIQEDEDQEFSISLSVGDGRFLVDLGSSSEFIIDEECILQLFKSCRECNRQCTVRKTVKGLKLVVSQACRFCHSRCKWTNLPSDDDDDEDDEHFQMNQQDSAR